ncbi:6-phosphogluconolactonase/Glucosamine-6-phosphateisomerase/deaminase [Streptococcus pneumoniae]|nr:6-phosphogluconolactonase/Glucosamine-6-phosphateisomerase/deaminase [Streptococcus pneumoniae]
MKVIKVENQVQGGKVAFEILKEKLANGAQTLGLRKNEQIYEYS